ncbi:MULTISPECIES: NAD(P)H-dependent glycerol-3-phosphate dehydrogenase [unclassified Oceanispirochaeta]|uniref:NAD(P)H-dependent glycerol-3-phosphate dehydrogenase n=1 Tax=unclassified Oceanispirochaeta TaxID=2635722 RepID=UPI000E09377A|nr:MULTISPECIES: NAD(P)H-dependent glycerol-3-phosphate dehydrogenase [unclassified Oceanispirochaeta]MBF9017043.1 NAD(P)-dependent glycerol-3-phosphate dehydrogenase [Oceanispirochaeta sp. M2]NPD73492.1 NAD(P)-dependent glycerol-3-phosphate dehydrogenase [Oceanispirochaeta sp. M1]RDG30783.1 NAD(P)-dependent glycerol-3-phosphate dehydrogenase [Oceanispirochaeta sp. M1]
MSDKKIGIIGAGAFGSAIAKILGQKNLDTTIWSFTEEGARDINEKRENCDFLPGVTIPPSVRATTDIVEAATGKDYLILATPSLFLVDTLKQILSVPNILEGETLIATITKGFAPGRNGPQFILETMENYLPGFYKGNLVYISGPSHAEEIGAGKITGLISASVNPRNSIEFRELLSSPNTRLFSSLDVVGVQTCAALKNVVAIAFGILDALKETTDRVGDNTESFLFAAGLNEIQLLGKSLGSTHPETFTSIAGVGDLDVTCRSQYGRNRRFGRDIVLKRIHEKYKGINDLIENIGSIGYLPEGAIAAQYAVLLGEKYNLKLPIIQLVYSILNRELQPEQAINLFLS